MSAVDFKNQSFINERRDCWGHMQVKFIIAILILLVVTILPFFNYTQTHVAHNTLRYELPAIHTHDQIITHLAYTLQYSEEHEQAQWVAYRYTKSMTVKKYPRTNKFRPDLSVATGSSDPSDYKNSHYDKGHLVPCDDMRGSQQAESESFLMSNMSPQTHSFNAGIWKRLEGLMRKYAIAFDTIYIATGPILEKGLSTIGPNKVSIPKYFYKVVLVYREHCKGAIGFILPHKQSNKDLLFYAVPVDSVEKRTGINFFAMLPDSIQNKLEATFQKELWRN